MIELKKVELTKITGGALSGTLVNGLTKAVSTLMDIGRSLGSAIRRVMSNNLCKF